MKLPGLRRQRELRCWSVADLARFAGLTWPTAAQADAGREVSSATARKILGALEANPLSETAVHLHRPASEARPSGIGEPAPVVPDLPPAAMPGGVRLRPAPLGGRAVPRMHEQHRREVTT